jgi:Na+-driven multidrug efflux pump
LRECFRFVLPAFGIYASPALMSLIDAAFVGRLSTLELAALGPASSISDSAPNPLLFISIGATNLCARAFATKGSGDVLATTTRTSLSMGTAGGFMIAGLVTANAASLAMAYCSGNAALAVPCARYVYIRALAIPAVVIATVAQAICIGVKDTTTPMIAVGLSAALNLAGNFVLITCLGQGLAGAAWATSASQLCAAALLLRALAQKGFLRRPPRASPAVPKMGTEDAVEALDARVAPRAVLDARIAPGDVVKLVGQERPMDNGLRAVVAEVGQEGCTVRLMNEGNRSRYFPFKQLELALKAEARAVQTEVSVGGGGGGGGGSEGGGSVGGGGVGGVGSFAVARALMGFVPFLFVMGVKIGMHNGCAATAASLGGVPAAAHTALFATAMLCFTMNDVGSSLCQAYLPAFSSGGTFNLQAARPTLEQLLRCTLCISLSVVALSSFVLLGFGSSFTTDPAVLQQMHQIVPLMATTLSLHGTAITLEGMMLARRAFRAMWATYAFIALSVTGMLAIVRRSSHGLLSGLSGVWRVYIFFQLVRILGFAWGGGLLQRQRARPVAQ